jgi:hypothetical protein
MNRSILEFIRTQGLSCQAQELESSWPASQDGLAQPRDRNTSSKHSLGLSDCTLMCPSEVKVKLLPSSCLPISESQKYPDILVRETNAIGHYVSSQELAYLLFFYCSNK